LGTNDLRCAAAAAGARPSGVCQIVRRSNGDLCWRRHPAPMCRSDHLL